MTAAMVERNITGYVRVCAFLAQCGHESGGFAHVREIWGPTAAQARYEYRADLGNKEPGDGVRFLGRGPIQITGRANYRACGRALGLDLERDPGQLELPTVGARAAAWFWDSRGLNELADAGKFDVITRRINGGLNGYDDRVKRLVRAREALSGATL